MARKQTTPECIIDPVEIFETGYSHLYFARIALNMYFERIELPNLLSPLATYSSLSLELFLKALIFETTKHPSDEGHDLVKLWEKLDESHRNNLIQLIGMPVVELDKCLNRHKNMFSAVRYNYELSNVDYNVTFLINIAEIVGYYFNNLVKNKSQLPSNVTFNFHSISRMGQLTNHLINGNTELYKTFSSHHRHHRQITLNLDITLNDLSGLFRP